MPLPGKSDIRAVLFDCDGVLVDTEPLGRAILLEELRACLGEAAPLDEATLMRIWPLGAPLGWSLGEARRLCLAKSEEDSRILAPDAWPPDLESRIRSKMGDQLALRSYATPGMPELYELLCKSKRCRVGICSNGPMTKMRQSLRRDDFPSLAWSQVFSGHEIGSFKPDPELLRHAAQSLGVDVRNILLVDDSEAGMNAAAGVSMPACLFGKPTSVSFKNGKGTWTATDAQELSALLNRLGLIAKQN